MKTITEILNELPDKCKAELDSFIEKIEKEKNIPKLEIELYQFLDYGLVWQYYFQTKYGIISLFFSDDPDDEIEIEFHEKKEV